MSKLLLPGDWAYDPEANIIGVIKTVSNDYAYIWQTERPNVIVIHESQPLYLSAELVAAHGHLYANADKLPYLAQRQRLLMRGENTRVKELELDDDIKRQYRRYL